MSTHTFTDFLEMKVPLEIFPDEQVDEAFKFRVHANGQKQKKRICPKGYKPSSDGNSCVPITASERNTMKVAHRKASITKKAAGASMQKRAERRRKKAMKYRRMFGVKDGS